jgi:class 3 adenylate cyclase
MGEAMAYKREGFYFYDKTQYDSTEYYWLKALDAHKRINDFEGISNLLNNLGSTSFNQGNNKKALEYYLQALEAGEKAGNKLRIATSTMNIGLIYMAKPGTYDQSLFYSEKARKLAEELKNTGIITGVNANMAEIYLDRGNDTLAYKHILMAKSAGELGNDAKLPHVYNTMAKVYQKRKQYDEAKKWLDKGFELAGDNKLYKSSAALLMGENYFRTGDFPTAIKYYDLAKQLSDDANTFDQLKKSYKGLARTFSEIENYKLAYVNENAYSRLSDSLANFKTDSIQSAFELGLKEKEIKLSKADLQIAEQEIGRQKLVRNAFLVGFALVVTLIGILYRDYKNKIKTNRLLDQRKAEIERLLINILPFEVAAELQKTGKSQPRYYESTTVMFTDFVGFSRIAETLTPQEITAELNEFFTEMDEIIDKYGLEKIKTIGDSYMCAGGIPTPSTTHPIDMVRAGLEIVEYLKKKNQAREEAGLAKWEIRMGLNTGSLVAGVVGKKKYAYDIWGSAVNIASSMESNGQPGMLNISVSTYELIKDQFECEYRGKIYAKNVGEIDMYFVKRELTNGSLAKNTEDSATAIAGP